MSNLDIPFSINEQLDEIKKYVSFEENAQMKVFLEKEGYFRISRYGKFLISKSNELGRMPNQDDLYDLYDFDIKLRELFFRYTQKAEIYFKSLLANSVSLSPLTSQRLNNEYTSSTFYLDENLYTPSRGEKDKRDRRKNIERFKKNFYPSLVQKETELRTYANKYPELSMYRNSGVRQNMKIPAWTAFMYFDMGTVEHIYLYLNAGLKKELLKTLYPNSTRNFRNIDTKNMDTYISAIRSLRNTCSHHNILVGTTSLIVHADVQDSNILVTNTDLFSRIYALKKVLHSSDREILKEDLKELISITSVDVYLFKILPNDWESRYNRIYIP